MAVRPRSGPRMSPEEREKADFTLQGADASRRTGFEVVNWLTLDPWSLPDALILRFQNNQAAKKWCKRPADKPLPKEEVENYLRHRIATETRKEEDRVNRFEKTREEKKEALSGFEERVEARKQVYLKSMVAPLLQDEKLAGELAFLEVKLDDLKKEMATLDFSDEEGLLRFKTIDAIYQSQLSRYQQILKDQGATRSQRDAKTDGKSGADFFSDIMEGTRDFIADNMNIVLCHHAKTDSLTCETEIAWLWYAFEHTHDALPFYAAFICGACGGLVEIGDRPTVLQYHLAQSLVQ